MYLHCRNSQTGVTKEEMVFCTDILDIVTKDFFSRKSKSRRRRKDAAVESSDGLPANTPRFPVRSVARSWVIQN